MEVDGETAASVQDASVLKKESVVVDEKSNNAVVAEKNVVTAKPASTTESDLNKKCLNSETNCGSKPLNDDDENKLIAEEKDDLLDQIEEVCHDRVESTEDISKASENEFLKKIDDLEKNDNNREKEIKEKLNCTAEELKAKNIIECEASAVDDIVVGDKVLDVKDETVAGNKPLISLSVCDDKDEKTPSPSSKASENLEKSSAFSELNVECTTSSTTDKIENNSSAVSSTLSKNETKLMVQLTETKIIETVDVDGEKRLETLREEEKMEVDENITNKVVSDVEISDVMDVDDVKMLSEGNSLVNESQPKEEVGVNDVIMEENLAVLENEEKKNEKCDEKLLSDQTGSINSSLNPEDTKEKILIENNKTLKHHSELSSNPPDEDDSKNTDLEPITDTDQNKTSFCLKTSKNLKENIVSSSLNNTPVSTSNVFNSTPIQKQFEISSENVSKISNAAEISHNDKEEEATSTKPSIKSFDDSTTESGTFATSETDHPSSDGTTKKYIDVIKKYNGMPDTTTDEETSTPEKNQKLNEKFEIELSNLSGSELKKDSTYEVNVCCDKNDVRYLSIERVDLSTLKNKCETEKPASECSVQSSSNGSVTSLPPYPFPQTINTPTSESTSSSVHCHSLIASSKKHTVLGIEELCNLMINQFTKIKHAVNPESAKQIAATALLEESAPTHEIKKSKKISPSADTPSTSASKSKRARKRSIHDDDVESIPKAKQVKRDINKDTPKTEDVESVDLKVGPCVLAKWVDKKFYAGKITAEKPGKKYVVLFEDGASKTLPKDAIVFGEGDTLPLQDQKVYALVDEDYEHGVVMSIEKSSNKVYYNIKTENTTVKVTASDIYLEVDQAKEIQKIQNINNIKSEGFEEEELFGARPSRNKRPPASPSTPEAGYSGAIGKRGGKRQKRYS